MYVKHIDLAASLNPLRTLDALAHVTQGTSRNLEPLIAILLLQMG